MSKLNKVWVVGTGRIAPELMNGAALLGEDVSLVWAGDKEDAVNVANTIFYLGELYEQKSFLNYLPTIAHLANEHKPDLILTNLSRDGRIAASYIAANLKTNVLTDVTEIWVKDGEIYSKRMVYGGNAIKTEKAAPTAVACVGSGVFEVASTPVFEGNFVEVEIIPGPDIKFKEKTVKEVKTVNLSAAKRVVCIGLGLESADNLPLVEEFAAAIGAEIACTRPVAEEEHWLGRERYVGISGAMIKPDLILVAGVSGQIQHTAGMNQSGTVVAINTDPAAPIFRQCDYGIVGDLKTVLPALTKKYKI